MELNLHALCDQLFITRTETKQRPGKTRLCSLNHTELDIMLTITDEDEQH